MNDFASWVAVGIVLVTSTLILLNRDWRLSLGMLALQYLAAFWLVTRHLPFVMGSAKLITGWMVVTTLGSARLGGITEEQTGESSLPQGYWFRLVMVLVISMVSLGATPRIEAAIPGMGFAVIAGSVTLMAMGILHISLSTEPLNIILGLLTVLTGFEIIYSAIESSILITGLLAITNLALGLAGAYLLIAGTFPAEIEAEDEA